MADTFCWSQIFHSNSGRIQIQSDWTADIFWRGQIFHSNIGQLQIPAHEMADVLS